MKKLALYGLLALCAGFTACDEVDETKAGPQTWPQLPGFSAENLSVTVAQPADMPSILLEPLANENASVAVATYDAKDFPFTEYDLEMIMEISKTDAFTNYGEAPAVVNAENQVLVSAMDIQNAYYAAISKDPSPADINVRFAAYAVNGTSKIRLGGEDKYYGVGKLNITPCPNPSTISQSYYLIGTVSDNTVAKALKLNHSDASVYDDPTFYVKVDITADQAADGFKWKVISEEAFKAGNTDAPGTVFGQEYEDEDYTEGTLFPNTADFTPGYGVVYEEGPHMFTFDMDKLTYTIALTIENLYTPGGSNGWNQAASQMLYTTDYANYMGFAHLNGEFKFTSQPDWNGINFGNSGEEGKLSTDGGAGNLSASADALYWCQVNITSLTYSITEITSCGVIGELNSWGGQEALTPSADFLTWTGTIDFGAGGEWKIRFNDNWDINLGGDMNNLSVGGANMKASAGVHKVTLNLGSLPYTVTVE